jgi:voltage-gated potassium channel
MTAEATERTALRRRWEKATNRPLMVGAVIFLAAYALPVLEPDLPTWLLDLCRWLSWITWGDLHSRPRRTASLSRRAPVLPSPALVGPPGNRPTPAQAVTSAPADPAALGAEPAGPVRVAGRVSIYAAGGASLLAFVAALAVLDVERSSPDANTSDFGDAIWWAVSTMTTVGYGDHYPVTSVGRVVAFGLMLGGIALLGTVTATLASWLVETVAAEKQQAEDLHAIVRRLEAKVDRLAAEPRSHDLERTSLHHPIAVPPAMVAAIRAASVTSPRGKVDPNRTSWLQVAEQSLAAAAGAVNHRYVQHTAVRDGLRAITRLQGGHVARHGAGRGRLVLRVGDDSWTSDPCVSRQRQLGLRRFRHTGVVTCARPRSQLLAGLNQGRRICDACCASEVDPHRGRSIAPGSVNPAPRRTTRIPNRGSM